MSSGVLAARADEVDDDRIGTGTTEEGALSSSAAAAGPADKIGSAEEGRPAPSRGRRDDVGGRGDECDDNDGTTEGLTNSAAFTLFFGGSTPSSPWQSHMDPSNSAVARDGAPKDTAVAPPTLPPSPPLLS